jgi:hypothetical protein
MHFKPHGVVCICAGPRARAARAVRVSLLLGPDMHPLRRTHAAASMTHG